MRVERYHAKPTDELAHDRRVRGGSMLYFDRRLLGKRLRSLREARGWTVRDVGERLDRLPSSIDEVERGRWIVSVGLLARWLRLFEIDLLVLLGARR